MCTRLYSLRCLKMETIKNIVVGTRMPSEDANLLKEVCKARGESISSFIRRSIRTELARLSFLSDAEKKALGFPSISKHSPQEVE